MAGYGKKTVSKQKAPKSKVGCSSMSGCGPGGSRKVKLKTSGSKFKTKGKFKNPKEEKMSSGGRSKKSSSSKYKNVRFL